MLAARDVLAALPDPLAWALVELCERQLGSSTSTPDEALTVLRLLELQLEAEVDQVPWTTLGGRRAVAATGRLVLLGAERGPSNQAQLEEILWGCAQARPRSIPDFDGFFGDVLLEPDGERTLRHDLAAWALGTT